jgi:POT family proton-dependent oligopeptide transporter
VTSGFSSLSNSPPELWKAYLLKFLDSYAYFSFSLVFTLFLSNEFGMNDIQAGTIYGAWGALITIFGLFTGTVIDNLGVATCLRIGFVLSFVTRLTLFLCTSRTVLLACTLVALPLGNCLGIPVLTVGIRRYTNEENRGFAFGLFYVVMNIGALVAGPLVDILTIYYNGGETEDVQDSSNDDEFEAEIVPSTWVMTTNRAIILSGVVANFFAVGVAFSVREIKVDASTKTQPPSDSAVVGTGNNNLSSSNSNDGSDDEGDGFPETATSNRSKIHAVKSFQPLRGSSFQILSETVRTPNFRRFLLVCLLTLNVRMVFRHLDGTLPKYMIREFGADTPKGLVYSINPALIIILVPIITAATTRVPPLVMIHYGTYVSAMSVFFLAFSTSVTACILFVITLSVGEALWSPRLYDFTMSVAQEGREGTYMALSSAPLFLAKLPVGFLSGVLLSRYCPEHLEEGEARHSKTMWWIIGLSTIVSPIMITVLWDYISSGDRGKSGDSGGIATRISTGERVLRDDDDIYFPNEEEDVEDSYQNRPLTTNISLPRVRGQEQHTLT